MSTQKLSGKENESSAEKYTFFLKKSPKHALSTHKFAIPPCKFGKKRVYFVYIIGMGAEGECL